MNFQNELILALEDMIGLVLFKDEFRDDPILHHAIQVYRIVVESGAVDSAFYEDD
jgi:hypothetical protein